MTDSDPKHALVTTADRLQAMRSRLETERGAPIVRTSPRPYSATCLVLDASGSMGGSEDEVRRGALGFAQTALARGAVGVIRFGSSTVVDLAPSRDEGEVRRACTGYAATLGGTDLVPALTEAGRLLAGSRERALVLVSDGQPSDPTAAIELARTLRASGVRIVTIGTAGADEAFLARIAGDAAFSCMVARRELGAAITDAARLLR